MMMNEDNEKVVKKANRVPLSELKDVIESVAPSLSLTASNGNTYDILLYDSKTIPKPVFEACFKLVESNLKHMCPLIFQNADERYATSSFGWSPKSKKAEMREPATRFIVIHKSTQDNVLGFISWQVDTEEDKSVIYCYELQLHPTLQRSCLGAQLMRLLEHMGSHLSLSKAMLTVFTTNTSALSFYTKLGYTPDAASPQPWRTLRSKRTITPDYRILSKSILSPTPQI